MNVTNAAQPFHKTAISEYTKEHILERNTLNKQAICMVKPSHIAVVLGIMRKVSLQRNPTHVVSVVVLYFLVSLH